MKYQLPAEGIMLNRDFGNSKFYTVTCNCGNTDDDITLEVEADEFNVTVHVWTKVKSNWWNESSLKRFLTRIKITWTLWTKGYVEMESWTLLTQQQALNFSETLTQAISDVSKFQKGKK